MSLWALIKIYSRLPTASGSALRTSNPRLGGSVCLPATCSATRIQSFVGEFLKTADLQITNDYNQSDWCLTNESQPFDSLDIVCMWAFDNRKWFLFQLKIFISFAELFYRFSHCCWWRARFTSLQWFDLIVCFDIVIGRTEFNFSSPSDKPHELFAAFSVYRNGAKLFDVSRNDRSNVLHCLSGLKALAMVHIMFGHRFGWTRAFPNVNSKYFAVGDQWSRTLVSALVAVQPIAVDSFFVMGGLLLARSVLHSIEKFAHIFCYPRLNFRYANWNSLPSIVSDKNSISQECICIAICELFPCSAFWY